MIEELENLEEKSSWGGAREGSGRPAGSKNKATMERKAVEEAMKERIMRSADALLNSQMNLAKGVQMLYVIKTETDEKGNKRKLRPELVTSQFLIEEYLAGELTDDHGNRGDNEDEYYFITTERPDNRAIDSLFDRTFGKARQNIGLDGGEEGRPILIMPPELMQKNDTSLSPSTESDSSGQA